MLEQARINPAAERSPRRRGLAKLAAAAERFDSVRGMLVLAAVTGVCVWLMHRPFSQPVLGDSAGYDYIAQCILRGQIPYRDTVDIKGPGSTYLAALAMSIGKLVGIRDVIAARLFQGAMLGALSAVTYLVAEINLRSRIAGVLAFLIPLMSDHFGEWTASGVEPKLPTMLFGMLSLLLIARNRPFWAGFCSMMSCLCWQPGLMFTGVAVLMFTKYLTNWRDLRWLRVLLGAAIPLALVLGYFYLRGALRDLWAWTITYNYSVFAAEGRRTVGIALSHLWRVSNRIFGSDLIVVGLGVAGLIIYAARQAAAKFRGGEAFRDSELFRDAVVIPPLVYFAFTLINFQAGPDLIPHLPFIGIFAASFFLEFRRVFSARAPAGNVFAARAVRWSGAITLAAVLGVVLARGARYRLDGGVTLREQDRQFQLIARLLGPDDKMYVHGTAELLVILNRPNMNPYLYFDFGIDKFLEQRKYGDFSRIIDEMEAAQPKLVALSRLKMVASRDQLANWVDQRYEKLPDFTYSDVYIRK